MINAGVVYKIRYFRPGVENAFTDIPDEVHWIHGSSNGAPKYGGSGKTWTSLKLAEKTLKDLNEGPYNRVKNGTSYEIATFDLIERK